MRNVRHQRVLWWIYGAFCFLCTLSRIGYDALSVNAPVQLALVAWLRDTSLFAFDPVRETYPYYTFPLWRLIALAPETVPLDKALFVLWAGTRILLIYAAFRFARSVAPDNPLAWISAMGVIAAVPVPQIGSGTLLSSHFEHTSATIPFILLCATAFWEKRYLLCGVWLGIVADLNPLYALYLIVYLVAWGVMVEDWRGEWKQGWKIIVTAMPVALPALLSFLSRPPVQVDDIDFLYWVNRIRSPRHLFPLAFERWRWVAYGCSLLLVLLVLGTTPKEHKLWRQIAWTWCLAALLFVGLAFLAAYGVKSYWLLTLSAARASDVWICLTSVLVVGVTSEQVRRTPPGSRARYARLAIWVVTIIWWGTVHRPQTALGAVLVCLFLAWLWEKPSMSGVLKQVRLPAVPYSSALPVLLVLTAVAFTTRHYFGRLPNIRMFDRSEIHALASWCRAHTPRDAVFLIPPTEEGGWTGFRFLAQRGIFVSWKDGTNVLFAPSYACKWIDRMAMIEPQILSMHPTLFQPAPLDTRTLSRRYHALEEAQARWIAVRFKVDYWIVPVHKPTALPEVYRDGKWKALMLNLRGRTLSAPSRYGIATGSLATDREAP